MFIHCERNAIDRFHEAMGFRVKRRDVTHNGSGLDTYDYGARQYNSVTARLIKPELLISFLLYHPYQRDAPKKVPLGCLALNVNFM